MDKHNQLNKILSPLLTKIIMCLCLIVCWANNTLASSYDSITYNLSTKNIKNAILNVEVVLQGEFKDKLVLNLPFVWAGADYQKQIQNIKISPNYKIDFITNDKDSKAVIILPKNHKGVIKLSYEVHQKIGNPSDVHAAIIRNDLVHAPGYGILAVPEDLEENDKISVRINWLDLDPKWKIVTSHGIAGNLNFKATPHEILHAIYVAGDIKIQQIADEKSPVYLSLYGSFDFEDDKIIADITQIIDSQRKFFNDYDFPYHAISLIEGDDPQSMGGTALKNSFTAFIPHDMHRNDYYILLAHELLHSWIGGGGKIGNNEFEELNYWWTEGFTEYYTRLFAYRYNGIDQETFINEINKFLRCYYLSSVNQEPNSRIKKDFWHNYDIEKLPYYRGFVFALYLNDLIKQENSDKSLDDIMHDLFKNAPEHKFSIELFKEIASRYIKKGIDQEITNFIDNGKLIPLGHINLPIKKSLIGQYHLGFDRDAIINQKVIKNIDIKSNAYKAGLRNEQYILGYSITNGYPIQMVTIETADNEYRFIPEHYNKEMVFQIKSNFSAEEEKQFLHFFGK